MSAKTLMIQGTASHVGKTLLVAAFCRYFKEEGLLTAPFKAQNMSLNSFVTKDGKEIARAQVVQAEAAGVEPLSEMNPILLKPGRDNLSQVIIRGRVLKNMDIREYYAYKKTAWQVIKEDLHKLRGQFQMVVMEGAGSPAEINLKENDLTNMAVAKEVHAPVMLVGDISCGGVFASLIGTWELLEEDERRLVKGIIINKFRGQKDLLLPGIEYLEKRTGVSVLGVLPYLSDLKIMAEDSLSLKTEKISAGNSPEKIKVAIIRLPRISNFTDFDPLINDAALEVVFTDRPEELVLADLIIVPGTKNTIEDLQFIRGLGIDRVIYQAVKERKIIFGICGGYQMLGGKIKDPDQVESSVGEIDGLGLLPIETVLKKDKQTFQVAALDLKTDLNIKGYEIHLGETFRDERILPLFKIIRRGEEGVEELEGAISPSGRVMGSYIHGLFDQADYRQYFIRKIFDLRGKKYPADLSPESQNPETEYKRLSQMLRENLDLHRVREFLDLI